MLGRVARPVLAAALLVLQMLAPGRPAHAESSPWHKEAGAAVRLISAGRDPQGAYRVALEMDLDPGVKTYWRTPGEAGVPPLLDWSRSINLALAEIAWPAPSRFDDAGSTGFGYLKRVVFPIEVVPQRADLPVDLALELDFAVCRDLCVPLRAEFALEIDPLAPPDPLLQDTFERAKRTVPRKVGIGDPGMLRVDSVRLEKTATPPRLQVSLAGPRGAPPELFVETPEDWPAAKPMQIDAQDGAYRFSVPLKRYDGEKGTVILTAVSAGQGIELAIDPADVAE